MHRLSLPFLLCLLIAPGVRAAEPVQATDLSAGLRLVEDQGAWVVQRSGEQPQRLDPGYGFRPFAIAALADGWVLSGTRSSGETSELVILRGGGPDGVEPLAAPAQRLGPQRGNPVPFVDQGRLVGLAWLEGSWQEDLGVRAAEWLGGEWGPVEEVSPGGDGAQLAPAAVVLGNGDWLLLWSGFDGEDDEILWSRRNERTWSPPRRLHEDNRAPDITPTAVAMDGGALAAWSSFHDGHYRLRVARLGDGGWQLEATSSGKGELHPRAFVRDGSLLIVHRSVIPDGWVVRELDSSGTALRNGFVDLGTSQRPVVLAEGDDGLELYWSGAGNEWAGTRHAPHWQDAP